jgi:hypothetical protein
MHWQLMTLIAALAIALAAETSGSAQQPKEVLAGWKGIFPDMGSYSRMFQPAVVEGDKKNPIYRQSADYVWTGGADRHYTITVARDANYKKIYSDEEVQKSKPAAEKVQVGKHKAWLWKYELNRKDVRPLRSRLVVLLGDDRILIVEQKGLGPFGGDDAVKTAELFDLAKVKAALDNPPQK